MEARHLSFLRRVLGLPTTWGSIKSGTDPIRNSEVLTRAGFPTFSGLLAEQQLLALGHLYRAGPTAPQCVATYDRYLAPRYLPGTRRPGLPRRKWYPYVLALAGKLFGGHEHYIAAAAELCSNEVSKVCFNLAQDRQ
eukprot:9840163-Alexandrium_andersonii.AAC.1